MTVLFTAPTRVIVAVVVFEACTGAVEQPVKGELDGGPVLDATIDEVGTAGSSDVVGKQPDTDVHRQAQEDGLVTVDQRTPHDSSPGVDGVGAEVGTAPDDVVEVQDSGPGEGVGESCHVELPSDVAPIDDYAPTLDGRCWPDLVLDCNTPADCKVLCQPVEGYWCFAASSADPHTMVAGYKNLAGRCYVNHGPSLDSGGFCRPTKITCENCRCKGTDYKGFKNGWPPESATECLDPAVYLDPPP